ERMLNNIAQAIPNVIGAALILFIAWIVGRWVSTLTQEGLESIGFDSAVRAISNAGPVRAGLEKSDPTQDAAAAAAPPAPTAWPPSRLVGFAVLIGIILFAAVEAANLLKFAAMSAMLSGVLDLAASVVVGALIIAVGVVVANILSAAVSRRDEP